MTAAGASTGVVLVLATAPAPAREPGPVGGSAAIGGSAAVDDAAPANDSASADGTATADESAPAGGSANGASTADAAVLGGPGGRRLAADELANQLVAERLCACVNVLPHVVSTFHWQGRVDRADECLLLIKTTRARLPALQARLVALHPYEVPEVLVLDVAAGLPAYLAWVAAAVAPPGAGVG